MVMRGMLLNRVVLEEYDSSRAKSFIYERNRIASILKDIRYEISHINEGSVKFTLAEPVTDIGIALVDAFDLDLVRIALYNAGYAMVKKSSSYTQMVFYRLEGPYVKSRIYVFKMDGPEDKFFQGFKRYLLESYQHVNEFNSFMRKNYEQNKNDPEIFRKKRIEFIKYLVHRNK